MKFCSMDSDLSPPDARMLTVTGENPQKGLGGRGYRGTAVGRDGG